MTMTDPVADLLTRLRNANSAYHDRVTMPHSKIKTHIAEILQQEGYIAGWVVVMAEGKIVAEGPPEVVMMNPAVIDAYLGAHQEIDLGVVTGRYAADEETS